VGFTGEAAETVPISNKVQLETVQQLLEKASAGRNYMPHLLNLRYLLECSPEDLTCLSGLWKQLAAVGSSWKQLEAVGSSWEQLGAVGGSWEQ
jgi:hypothetical protein